jgi:hypothetical protein
VHDFNGGTLQSGLFWTVQVPTRTFRLHGKRASLHVENLPVIDSFVIGGPGGVAASVDIDIRWEATESPMPRGSGAAVPADSPAAFTGLFAQARAAGVISGSEVGFSFTSERGLSSDGVFAEIGTERNGALL